MRLLKEFGDLIDAESLASRLENRGVMTFISSTRSHSFSKIQTGATKVGVWIVLENQYEDGFILLRNKRHKVREPLTLDEMEILREKASQEFSQSLSVKKSVFLTWLFSIALVFFAGIVVYAFIETV